MPQISLNLALTEASKELICYAYNMIGQRSLSLELVTQNDEVEDHLRETFYNFYSAEMPMVVERIIGGHNVFEDTTDNFFIDFHLVTAYKIGHVNIGDRRVKLHLDQKYCQALTFKGQKISFEDLMELADLFGFCLPTDPEPGFNEASDIYLVGVWLALFLSGKMSLWIQASVAGAASRINAKGLPPELLKLGIDWTTIPFVIANQKLPKYRDLYPKILSAQEIFS